MPKTSVWVTTEFLARKTTIYSHSFVCWSPLSPNKTLAEKSRSMLVSMWISWRWSWNSTNPTEHTSSIWRRYQPTSESTQQSLISMTQRLLLLSITPHLLRSISSIWWLKLKGSCCRQFSTPFRRSTTKRNSNQFVRWWSGNRGSYYCRGPLVLVRLPLSWACWLLSINIWNMCSKDKKIRERSWSARLPMLQLITSPNVSYVKAWLLTVQVLLILPSVSLIQMNSHRSPLKDNQRTLLPQNNEYTQKCYEWE